MGKIHELRVRSNKYVASINDNITQSVMQVDYLILDLNREQMRKRQVDAFDNPLPPYSKYWAQKKRLKYFNLFSTDSFQQKMNFIASYPKYLISSADWKLRILLRKVGQRMFGIAPSNQSKAKNITTTAIGRHYKSRVFKG
jgi:hypothetical protein